MRAYVGPAMKVLAVVLGVIGLILGVVFGSIAIGKSFSRYQAIQEANNTAQVARIQAANEKEVNGLRIAAQAQKVEIAKQDAQIRHENAKGIREAQDTISATLTPLYVQMQMVDALERIAVDGKNSTVIYLQQGPDGLPVVSNVGR